jgi:hypothetical protein
LALPPRFILPTPSAAKAGTFLPFFFDHLHLAAFDWGAAS